MCKGLSDLIKDNRLEGKLEGKIEGRTEERELLSNLYSRLLSLGRQDEMGAAFSNPKVMNQLLLEFGLV